MNKNTKQKGQKPAQQYSNVLESLKDLGGSTGKSLKEDLIQKAPEAFMDQLFGTGQGRSFSGEIVAGQSLEMRDVFSGQEETNQKLKKQLSFERRVVQEEKVRINKRTNELRIQLKAVMEQVVTLTSSTKELADEAKIAAMQASVEPGIYHIVFFEKLLEFLKSFRKKIDQASVWLHASNQRAQKKNYWSLYKKHGAKFLLSGEHYLTRSAG